MKTPRPMHTKTIWQWALIGALFGFLVLHPWVMLTAKLMFQSKDQSEIFFGGAFLSESRKAFSMEMLPWSLSYALISALAGAFLGRNRQVTEQLRISEHRFRDLSITDDLTQLYNSRHFYHQLDEEIERTNRYKHPLSLLMLDLDNFKKYNDAFGHIAGDEVLAKAGEILRDSLRKTDSAYRYGGEEFAVLLPETRGEEALHFAERIRQAFERQKFIIPEEQSASVTASIGVAQYEIGDEIEILIKRADKNMYVAKNEGKNRIHFS